jgi:hypothetical protein
LSRTGVSELLPQRQNRFSLNLLLPSLSLGLGCRGRHVCDAGCLRVLDVVNLCDAPDSANKSWANESQHVTFVDHLNGPTPKGGPEDRSQLEFTIIILQKTLHPSPSLRQDHSRQPFVKAAITPTH